ncbi:hypothetical protein GCM10010435_57590 [Winogradskya consettensis]|uniref:Uncharacterized protein n=1 Tax=Winogradskya consettensis TaxID=113560 RepID=A0A919S8Q1_9ACTN|nr:hypothetical protein [Actinoplanes consettensis]GIM67093.1 hypothetical protein Aco04nite_04730 [Actinoplanes consettensis]
MDLALVAVETLLIGVHDGHLTYRAAEEGLADNEHPDAAARRLAGFGSPLGSLGSGRLIHSTSWRFDAGRIVLTYAALPDPDPATAQRFPASGAMTATGTALDPSPPHVDRADVIAHAARHLAFLHRTDPAVAEAALEQPPLWALLDAYQPDVAGPVRPHR